MEGLITLTVTVMVQARFCGSEWTAIGPLGLRRSIGTGPGFEPIYRLLFAILPPIGGYCLFGFRVEDQVGFFRGHRKRSGWF